MKIIAVIIALVNSSHTHTLTAQKMKFSINDFFSKCEQIRIFLQICSHLLKKSLMENFIFCAVTVHMTYSGTCTLCMSLI